jgi:peptide deformylase
MIKTLLTLSILLFHLAAFAKRLPIITIGHPVLREVAKEVDLRHVNDPEFQTLVDDMITTMRKKSGVGLAAPQVNESLRLFVMRKLFAVPLTVVINPKLEYLEEFGKEMSVEGCLSIPGQRMKVERFKRVRLSYFDRAGKFMTEEASGLKAVIAQHEYDHLNGVLIVDLAQQLFTELNWEDYVSAPLM